MDRLDQLIDILIEAAGNPVFGLQHAVEQLKALKTAPVATVATTPTQMLESAPTASQSLSEATINPLSVLNQEAGNGNNGGA